MAIYAGCYVFATSAHVQMKTSSLCFHSIGWVMRHDHNLSNQSTCYKDVMDLLYCRKEYSTKAITLS